MPLKVVIIEDEKPAAQKLARDLLDLDQSIEILAIIHDVRSAVLWFQEEVEVDLVFMDVQLSDGLSFDIIEAIEVNFPIIFITAYDHYWQSALKSNGIDYLLKPVELSKLKIALDKYGSLRSHFTGKVETLMKSFSEKKSLEYKEKFLLRRGKELVLVPVDDIVLFKASEKVTMLYTKDSKRLIIEDSLLRLNEVLNPKYFIRANRKFIINVKYLEKLSMHSKGRIDVKMCNAPDESIIVSQEKASSFKERILAN